MDELSIKESETYKLTSIWCDLEPLRKEQWNHPSGYTSLSEEIQGGLVDDVMQEVGGAALCREDHWLEQRWYFYLHV